METKTILISAGVIGAINVTSSLLYLKLISSVVHIENKNLHDTILTNIDIAQKNTIKEYKDSFDYFSKNINHRQYKYCQSID